MYNFLLARVHLWQFPMQKTKREQNHAPHENVSDALIKNNRIKRTKSTSSQTYTVRSSGARHNNQPFFLTTEKSAEIKSYSRHLILQLRKLLQIATHKSWSLFCSIFNVPSRSKTGYSKKSTGRNRFSLCSTPMERHSSFWRLGRG